ncbi:HNH endonuclease [Natrialbaceae archaeon A-CW1-1]
MAERRGGQDKIPPAKRKERRELDGERCRLCPAKSPEVGGWARLQVHHRDPTLEGEALHALDNLITLCEACHSWYHKKPTGEDVPIAFTNADRRELLPHDYLILQVLAESGPCSMSELQDVMSLLVSRTAVRERIWRLMGLDYEVYSRDQPLVYEETETSELGLADQISDPIRGRTPDDLRLVVQRVCDELVRKALARGCDRTVVGEVFGISTRVTWHKQYRAQAYEFPLEEFERGPSEASRELTVGEVDASQLGEVQSQHEEVRHESQSSEPDTGSDTSEPVPSAEPDMGDLGRVETWGRVEDNTDEQDELDIDEVLEADT